MSDLETDKQTAEINQITKETNKCQICKKKLKLVELTTSKCKCDFLFCKLHKNDHNCSFNYKTEHQSYLESMNPKIEFEKHLKI